MAERRSGRTRSKIPPSESLTDHHGEWCAKCLNYSCMQDLGDPDAHHGLLRAKVKNWFRLKPPGRPLEVIDFDWTMSVHSLKASGDCHEEMNEIAASMWGYLKSILYGADQKAQDNDYSHFSEKYATWFHVRGYYWYAVLIHLDTLFLSKLPLSSSDIQRMCRNALSSGAGIRGAQNLPRLIDPLWQTTQTTSLCAARANLAAARDHEDNAKMWYEKSIQGLRTAKPGRPDYPPDVLRRRAIISRRVEHATDAIDAEDSGYSRMTGYVVHGFICMPDDPERALADCAAMEKQADLSWLYRASVHIMRGYYEASVHKDVRAAYLEFTRAQYIYVVLGLQLSLPIELNAPIPGSDGKTRGWTAAGMMRHFFSKATNEHYLDRRTCTELRNEAIRQYRGTLGSDRDIHDLRNLLLDPLCGRGLTIEAPDSGDVEDGRRRRAQFQTAGARS